MLSETSCNTVTCVCRCPGHLRKNRWRRTQENNVYCALRELCNSCISKYRRKKWAVKETTKVSIFILMAGHRYFCWCGCCDVANLSRVKMTFRSSQGWSRGFIFSVKTGASRCSINLPIIFRKALNRDDSVCEEHCATFIPGVHKGTPRGAKLVLWRSWLASLRVLWNAKCGGSWF